MKNILPRRYHFNFILALALFFSVALSVPQPLSASPATREISSSSTAMPAKKKAAQKAKSKQKPKSKSKPVAKPKARQHTTAKAAAKQPKPRAKPPINKKRAVSGKPDAHIKAKQKPVKGWHPAFKAKAAGTKKPIKKQFAKPAKKQAKIQPRKPAAKSKPLPAKPRRPVVKPKPKTTAYKARVKAKPISKPRVRPKTVPKASLPPKPAVKVRPVVAALPVTPPISQTYVPVSPPALSSGGETMVPITFLSNGLGASSGPTGTTTDEGAVWRISYFGKNIDLTVNNVNAIFDGKPVVLPAAPTVVKDVLYIPWRPIAKYLDFQWSFALTGKAPHAVPDASLMLVQYKAAYIEGIDHYSYGDRTRLVLRLSNSTRVVATRNGMDVQFGVAAARRPSVPTVFPINDYLVPRAVLRSGDWNADIAIRINYSVPVKWFTLGSPPRLVVDLEKVFEEQVSSNVTGGLSVTQIRKGTGHGPVQLFVVKIDREEGWRLRVAPAGYNTFQLDRPSRIGARNGAMVAVNGGFFATDGAAVGAVQVNGEWLRLDWNDRTAIGFRPDGSGRIDNLNAEAYASFGKGFRLPITDLNGWPDKNHITALTRHFRTTYKLRPDEMAVVVQNGRVIAKPGAGYFNIAEGGFALVANGTAVQWLNRVERGDTATLDISAPGWDGFTSVVGAGPRLVREGKVDVTAVQENFRTDVRVGLGPRTAVGIDTQGNYIIAVADGRQGYYSSGLTLTEMADVMQELGAVDAINMDGGGSTAIAVLGKVINRPSDGVERSVANALLVMH